MQLPQQAALTGLHLQCVALDPQADRVAAGDTTGRIHIWHQLRAAHQDVDQSGKPEVPLKRTCHQDLAGNTIRVCSSLAMTGQQTSSKHAWLAVPGWPVGFRKQT